MRLNAYLASCGAASRRKSEIIILEGRVRVNNKIILIPYYDVDLEHDEVKVDGKIIKPESHVYIVMNKPVGYVCAVSDKYDEVVINLLSKEDKLTRVFPVGRLDRDSEGLLILTNDGEFANNISHPSKSNKLGVNKEYEALLNIEINLKQLERWRGGFDIEVEDEIKNIKPLAVNIIDREPVNKWLSIIIAEGVKREIRLMANKAGFSVEKLIRVKIGNLKLEDFNLKPGEYVKLSFNEINNKIFNK
ncbi:MAG: rRNA pseudouridine synthase [Synergistaceae bacterium]|nr:rRNA pseudouridine synthase [Synergistaceae bacterium]MBQ4419635.1 rRNA pseudouridine synthase [Synergistaceae bacterium]MBQ7570258.1 rRNA pseudouridine synthase [Synergistaceae bacterium]MBR0096870.1 rRNA pseudouridine synthase [Synergistaceae bacterium]MBR0220772.1 rRNA pseudouridine synthase [Synergistaceae bacterium]